MIKTPQIFVIYEPGMYGTFLCNLFVDHPLYNDKLVSKQVETTEGAITAHRFGYVDIIKDFHNQEDIINLLKKKPIDLYTFFQPLDNCGLGVSRLASYYAVRIDFQKHFDKFVRIIVKPKKNHISVYAKRMSVTSRPDPAGQYWARAFSKKNWADIPNWFIDGMILKECEKYLWAHTEFLDSTYTLDPKRDIVFNPNDISNKKALEQMIGMACDLLEIEHSHPDFERLKPLMEKNKKHYRNKRK